MNNETKIKLIKKSIEDKTGKNCIIKKEQFDTHFYRENTVYTNYIGTISNGLLDFLPLSDPLEEQPTCPCTILDEPCAPHCTCKEPFSSRGCYLCAQYGSEEQRKAKAQWIKERVMSTVLEEQPDKGWISVETGLPEKGQRVLTMTDYGGYDVCYIRGDGQWTNSMRPQHTNGSVTHWQKLPSAPVKQG